MYAVTYNAGQWRLALMTGKRKELLPESFKSVRAACRAAKALNDDLWARQIDSAATEAA